MHTGAAFIASLAVMSVSLVGVLFSRGQLGVWMNRHLKYLATFSAGVFLLVAYHLAHEAVEEGGALIGVLAIAVGAALMEAINYFVPAHHHHEPAGDHAHSSIDGRRVLLSDALHNVGDGILLVGAFASSIYVGLAATVGVILHETVQEVSEYFVLREAGYTNRGALARNFLVSATILIGFFLAAYLTAMTTLVAILSGIAAGGFLSVVLHDLIPHAVASIRVNGGAYKHLLVGILGAGFMLGVQTLVPHEEPAPNQQPVVPNQVIQQTNTSATFEVPSKPIATTSPTPESATSTSSNNIPGAAPTTQREP